MSDTQEFLFLDSALLKQAVDMKKMKNLKKKVEWKNNKHGGNSVDLQIFCVSCGKPINVHTALCHMECCFAKYEHKPSIGSMYLTCTEGCYVIKR
ncbi:hypothetical protein MJG53_019734 [Ovis ammon polii x Ovis aries]|uniref:CpG binding protein C-terminal domain-containing protein n=2 Tax=Ovis TaxID=9935 RepID=A0A836CP53_SHEEP|nr:hypothetical protein JEQ12_020023 [Ovis aries]KAI4554435.1 hypothetical protein MJG53_019734 [Ovis ammon polii x Ovis aries]